MLVLKEVNKPANFEPYVRDINPKKGIRFINKDKVAQDGGQISGMSHSEFINSPKEFHSTHFKSFCIDSSHMLSTSRVPGQRNVDEFYSPSPPLDASVFRSTTMMNSLNPAARKPRDSIKVTSMTALDALLSPKDLRRSQKWKSPNMSFFSQSPVSRCANTPRDNFTSHQELRSHTRQSIVRKHL